MNKAIKNFVVDKKNKIIIGGDFNVTLDSNPDCAGGNPSNKDSIKNIQDICLDFDLVDIWRISASMICLDKEFLNEANRIIFDFIWKGRDKVKRLALISDVEDMADSKILISTPLLEPKEYLFARDLQTNSPATGKLFYCIT